MGVFQVLWYFLVAYFDICQGSSDSSYNFKTSDFEKVLDSPAFIDKSLFIKEVIDNNKTTVVTAPAGFMKSTAMNMLKRFLEIEVDESGNFLTKSQHKDEPVRDTPNYKVFTKRKLNILEDTEIMEEHFGSVPVLSVSFSCIYPVNKLDDALMCLRKSIHDAYKQHQYLVKSGRLTEIEKDNVESWCDDQKYPTFGKYRVACSLRELSTYLYQHFQEQRVFVVVDDHDCIFRRALTSTASNDEVDDIIRLGVCLINSVLKSNAKHVWTGVISGVLDVPVFGSSAHKIQEPDSYHSYRFLGYHQFAEFFGFTQEEFSTLKIFDRESLDTQYDGYRTNSNKHIYNPYSVLKFLEHGKIKNYWADDHPIHNLKEVLTIPTVAKAADKLLRGESIMIQILDEKVAIDDIIDYRNVLLRPSEQSAYKSAKFFFFMLEEGYLTTTVVSSSHTDPGDTEVRRAVIIPNEEIKQMITDALEDGGGGGGDNQGMGSASEVDLQSDELKEFQQLLQQQQQRTLE